MVYIFELISPITISEVLSTKEDIERVKREDRSSTYYDMQESLSTICDKNIEDISDTDLQAFNLMVKIFLDEQEQLERDKLVSSLKALLAKCEDFYDEGEHRRYVFFESQEISEKQALKNAGMSHGDLMCLLKQLGLKRYKWSKDSKISKNEFEVGEDDGFYHLTIPNIF
jgi:MFS superfamily sulfate permease-like transporter